ncbi:hypothetical protein SAY86_031918 [Trapa natans]|uniref:CTLH domain-containing protein n=1 Tax=Trapa natans TaxID=22666 RepID=A0AAN7LSM0_TRANT|nr:hypothetical protein SAY86_031918 [Trapa natans]
MESTPVNWESLDVLVVDFVRSENLIEDTAPSSSSSTGSSPSSLSSSSSYRSRLVNRQIRRSLEAGEVDAAIKLLRSHAPSILEDRRILFRLQKQKFIELLRIGKAEERNAAIECLRTSLAPSALDAYPEAYEEFKHILLAFIYDKDDQNSPVANEWSENKRFEIAGMMSSVLRTYLHAYDPLFSMTLRYLVSIHKEYCRRQGVSSPISDLNDRLLLEERDPPAILQESFYEAPPFDEVDIQALAHAVLLTRQGAIDSLKFAKGDLFLAFQVIFILKLFLLWKISIFYLLGIFLSFLLQNELCRMRLDVPMLDNLLREYCVYRGIIASGFLPSSEMQIPSEPSQVSEAQSLPSLSTGSSLEVESSIHKSPDAKIATVDKDSCCVDDEDVGNVQFVNAEQRYACEAPVHHEICSTAGCHEFISRSLQRSRSRSGERGKRKRWRGRSDGLCHLSDIFSDGRSGKSDLCTTFPSSVTNMLQGKEGKEKKTMLQTKVGEGKYEFVLEMKELVTKGMVAEAVEEVSSMDPDFFNQHPTLLFQLMQAQFLNLVHCGDHNGALRVACSHLGPLAAKDPSLLKPLKETLLALIQPAGEVLQRSLPLIALSSSLQVAIGRRLGIEEPQLMKIMRATLHSHNEWFKLQMCKDRFEGFLRINSLKDVNNPMLVGTLSKSTISSCTHGSSVVTTSSSDRAAEDGSSPMQVSTTDAFYDEGEILKVMEFLALPRAEAIYLLAQYSGSADTVIEQLFT